jgi:hypothetical protein
MTFQKSAVATAVIAAAALGMGITAANAHAKKHHHHHLFHGHSHGLIVIGSPHYGCKHWLRKYKRTGNPFFLDRYYACKY